MTALDLELNMEITSMTFFLLLFNKKETKAVF